jgi:glycosyltransferase involved in cell wall biosynthesis
VLVVGRFAARDQIEHAIAAISVALRQNPGWHLKVIGEGQVRSGVESQVAALGLQGSVEVDSSGADVREELARSALVLVTGAQEGFPQTLIEAMSCGTVPVAYRRPTAIEEIIDHGRSGWLVPPDDVEALARTTAAAMADHERRAAMSLAAAERSRDFSPEAIAPRWRDVISDLTEAMRYRRRMVARSA